MERRSSYRCPGAPLFPQPFYGTNGMELRPSEFVTLPRVDAVVRAETEIQSQAGLVYIKLHGSYGWKTSSGADQLVIGKNKTALINQEPLIQWYFNLLESTIRQGGKKLMIIGYGFQDAHINQLLVEGVEKYGLKLFVLSTTSPRDFEQRLRNGHNYALPLLQGLRGYFPYGLKEVFPSNQDETVQFRNIRDALLGS